MSDNIQPESQSKTRAKSRQAVDTIIHARWIIPVQPSGLLENSSVVIDAGRIVAVLPRKDCEQQYQSANTVERPHHVLIPGLINAHTHAAMSLLRGFADDLPLMDWLQNHIWPAESKWVDEAFVHDGTQLAIAEMIRGGTTCFNDMYFFPDVVAKVVSETGIRANIGMIVIDSPTVWAQDADEYIRKGLEVFDANRNEARIQMSFAPHAPYTVSDEALERLRILADELDVSIHMHIHETAFEVESSLAQYGMRPLERLDKLGLLTSRLQAVHMTQLLPGEIGVLAERGVSVVHCPESNMKLASGIAPIHLLNEAGVNIAIGTDGASSNNNLDMFGEMQTAALLAKNESADASAFAAETALYAATLGGAKALGLEHEVGSLEAGKAADLVAVDLMQPSSWPVYQPVAQIVYAVSRDQVSDVWVAGNQLLNDAELTQQDQTAILQTAANWAEKIAGNC